MTIYMCKRLEGLTLEEIMEGSNVYLPNVLLLGTRRPRVCHKKRDELGKPSMKDVLKYSHLGLGVVVAEWNFPYEIELMVTIGTSFETFRLGVVLAVLAGLDGAGFIDVGVCLDKPLLDTSTSGGISSTSEDDELMAFRQ